MSRTRYLSYPFNKLGMRDVLLRMGLPLDELSSHADVVSELHRLIESRNPLLLELNAHAMRSDADGKPIIHAAELVTLRSSIPRPTKPFKLDVVPGQSRMDFFAA